VVDAILTIKKDEQPIDLFMVEIMHMQHRTYVHSPTPPHHTKSS